MKPSILLFVACISATAFGQDQPPADIPERIQGYELAERYGALILQRAASPERLAVRKQIEEDFRLRLDQFYRQFPQIVQKQPIKNLSNVAPTPLTAGDPKKPETTTVEVSSIDGTETVTPLKPVPQPAETKGPAVAAPEKRELISDPQLQPASAESHALPETQSLESGLLSFAERLERIERRLLELKERINRLEAVRQLEERIIRASEKRGSASGELSPR